MEKRDRFLLEQKLMDCWHVTDDIDTVADYIGENSDIPARERDKLLNMLIGMRELYHLKFDRTLDLFAELIRNRTISGPMEKEVLY